MSQTPLTCLCDSELPRSQKSKTIRWNSVLVCLWSALPAAAICVLGCSSPKPLTAIVDGGSMAPNLLGEHSLLVCHDCGFGIKSRLVENPPMSIVCPNCGYHHAANAKQLLIPAAIMQVERVPGALERWDVVAFVFDDSSDSNTRSKLGVKRVVGLPNETVELVGGEIIVDDQPAKKDWRRQIEMAILVHDSQYRPGKMTENPPPRWLVSSSRAGWTERDGRFQFCENAETSESRLVYLNHAGYRTTTDRFQPVPVKDDCSFDPGESRELHLVTDLMLLADLECRGAEFDVEFATVEPKLSCTVSALSKTLRVFEGSSELAACEWLEPNRPFELGFSTFDGQITIAIDGKQLVRASHGSKPVADHSLLVRPISIIGKTPKITANRLRVFRDVFYFDSSASCNDGERTKPKYSLRADEYFVAGDNAAGSIDSRQWSHPGLNRKQIIGRLSNQR